MPHSLLKLNTYHMTQFYNNQKLVKQYSKDYLNPGFSLIELLIVIAIIGILVAIALPSYEKYTKRSHYAEIVEAAAPFKTGITECFQMLDSLEDCQAGQNGVPEAINNGQGAGLVDSITINQDASINIIPKAQYGISSNDNYLLAPTIENEVLIWKSSGGGVTSGYAN